MLPDLLTLRHPSFQVWNTTNDCFLLSAKNLSIIASGTLKQDVEEGAYIEVQVKYGLITLIKQKLDLCDQVVNIDLDCPLEKGPLKFTKTVELPAHIPPVSRTIP